MVLPDLRGMDMDEYLALMEDLGEPSYRARQLFEWVQQKGHTDLARLTNLPQRLRDKLGQRVSISRLEVVKKLVSKGEDTVKYLLRLPDQETVEVVLMMYTGRETRDRFTVCVSSQVGCAMGCRFCATGLSGWKRNLSSGEISGQVLTVLADLWQQHPRAAITNVVLMGMGEPLMNYEQVLKAVRTLNHPSGLKISFRRITLSTCGLVPEIRRLAREALPLELAVSLHAPNDRLRDQLVPINRKYPIAQLLQACRDYTELTGRRITFEYALVGGINDGLENAEELAKLLKGFMAYVNVIPVNQVDETGLHPPSPWRMSQFISQLRLRGIEAVLREKRGGDIEAACGQLRRRQLR